MTLELGYSIDWGATWAGVSAVAAFLAVAAMLYVMKVQITETKKLTSHQLFLQINSQYESEFMQRKRAILAYQLTTNRAALEVDDTVIVFFETLGLYFKEGLLDPKMVWNAFSVDVCSYWSACEHYIDHVRKEYSDDLYFEEFESLNNEMLKLSRV